MSTSAPHPNIVPQHGSPAHESFSTREAISPSRAAIPQIPDHELLRCVGRGSYGEVWLARNIMGSYRAVKVVYRQSADSDHAFDREFSAILKYEPLSRTHPSQLAILHVGKGQDYFYYVMELADDANESQASGDRSQKPSESGK